MRKRLPMWMVYVITGALLFVAIVVGSRLKSDLITLGALTVFLIVIQWAYHLRR